MVWETLKEAIRQMTGRQQGDSEDVMLSRRTVLTGLGLAGACAVAGPALIWADEAEADVIDVQYRGRGRGRGRGPRYSRRELQWRCRDWRFRRRHPRACSYAYSRRRRRRGSCVSVGPVTICD